jgi:hypothetical protein
MNPNDEHDWLMDAKLNEESEQPARRQVSTVESIVPAATVQDSDDSDEPEAVPDVLGPDDQLESGMWYVDEDTEDSEGARVTNRTWWLYTRGHWLVGDEKFGGYWDYDYNKEILFAPHQPPSRAVLEKAYPFGQRQTIIGGSW